MVHVVEFVSESNALVKAVDKVNHFLKENDGKIKITDIRHSIAFNESSGYVISSYAIFYEDIAETKKPKKAE